MATAGGQAARMTFPIPLISGGNARASLAPPTGSGAPFTALMLAPATPPKSAGIPRRNAYPTVLTAGSSTTATNTPAKRNGSVTTAGTIKCFVMSSPRSTGSASVRSG